MKVASPPPQQRCAIYTRKSTEHNLDLAFNSLDAQREACEAYVKSQAHEGWRLVPDHFDDGGLSGASLDRPALQGLLDHVRARAIDVIVVYKVDRLTRSLADFAKLVELFDAHGVSFVSVTQSFNTTSSMGRLTLNVLLSFAQFEREVIGERVRDKIAASKRKGLWVGGPVPLGYRSLDKQLQIVPEDAALVRKIFSDYLRVGSIGALAASLEAEGIKPTVRPATGRRVAASRFMVGPLAYLLKNRFYVGDIVYRGEIHRGGHEPILDRALFEAVQARLAEQVVARRKLRTCAPSLLSGLLFDDRGHAMSPSHANKKGVRYRYYVSQALLQHRKADAGSVARVSAPEIEGLVIGALLERVDSGSGWQRCASGAVIDPAAERERFAALIERVTIKKGTVEIALKRAEDDPSAKARETASPGFRAFDPTMIVPWAPPATRAQKGVRHAPRQADPRTQQALLSAIAKARGWMDELIDGRTGLIEAIAAREGIVVRHARFLAPLAFLSPRIVEAIVNGSAPAGLTVSSLARGLPHDWREQERRVGIR